MNTIKRLPRNCLYLYCVESFTGSVDKLYRSRSGKTFYLVSEDLIYSIPVSYLGKLSSKLIDAYERLQDIDK